MEKIPNETFRGTVKVTEVLKKLQERGIVIGWPCHKGCVRLTLFRNKNTWSNDLKLYVWRLEATSITKICLKYFFGGCLTISVCISVKAKDL